MLDAALQAGTAHRDCVFEVFARRLPADRAYFVNAGTGRLLDLIEAFRFGDEDLDHLAARAIVSPATRDWLSGYHFSGDMDGYAEGEVFLPGSPLLTVRSDFATGVLLETLLLSVLNHDVAVASAASRMWVQAEGRPLIEMGSRRTHEEAAVAAARAAWIAGFASTSNTRRRPPLRRAHGWHRGPRVHAPARHRGARRSPLRSPPSARARRCWSTPTTPSAGSGVRSRSPEPRLGAVRLDSGNLGELGARHAGPPRQRRCHRDPDRGDLRPGRVRDRRAAVRSDRHLRRRDLRRVGLGTSRSGAGLQAGRGRRPAGGEGGVRRQVQRRRLEAGTPPDRRRRRRGRRAGADRRGAGPSTGRTCPTIRTAVVARPRGTNVRSSCP